MLQQSVTPWSYGQALGEETQQQYLTNICMKSLAAAGEPVGNKSYTLGDRRGPNCFGHVMCAPLIRDMRGLSPLIEVCEGAPWLSFL